MKRLLLLLLFIGTAVPCPFAANLFGLEGRIPASITKAFLQGNYERIWKTIAPDTAIDTSAITIIYYSRADKRKFGVRLPEWGGGGAIGRDTIIIPVDRFPLADMDIGRVTVHELVHIALERAYGRLRLPRWFHEGLAMTLSGELLFEEQLTLSRAIFTKRLLPLDSIERVNRFDAFGAALAYSESHLAAALLIDKYGIDGIPELLAAVRKCGTFGDGFLSVFGFAPLEFERLVRNDITGRYSFLFFFSDTYLFWLLGALLVVAGFVAVKISNRKREKLMEEEERREDETKEKANGGSPPV